MKQIKIIPRNITTKNGKTFTAYKAVTNDDKLIDCKFRKSVVENNKLPTTMFEITVNKDDINLNTSTMYPTIWIKNIVEIKAVQSKTNAIIDTMFDDK